VTGKKQLLRLRSRTSTQVTALVETTKIINTFH